MANYFTNFSVALSLPNEAAQTYALDLAYQADQGRQGDQLPENFPPALAGVIEDWNFETEADSSALGSGCIRTVAAWMRSARSSNTSCRSSIPTDA